MPEITFIKDELDIKFLILYLLSYFDEPVNFGDLTDMALAENGVNYFEFSGALTSLTEFGHIKNVDGKGEAFSITEKGRRTAEAVADSLRPSVRRAAERSAMTVARKMRRDALVSAEVTEAQRGGFNAKLRLADPDDEILSIDVLVMSREQGEMLAENFKRNAEKIFTQVIQDILRDYQDEETVYEQPLE